MKKHIRRLCFAAVLSLASPVFSADKAGPAVSADLARSLVGVLRSNAGLVDRHPYLAALRDIDPDRPLDRLALLPIAIRIPAASAESRADVDAMAQAGLLDGIVAQAREGVSAEVQGLVMKAARKSLDPAKAAEALWRVNFFRKHFAAYLDLDEQAALASARGRLVQQLRRQRAPKITSERAAGIEKKADAIVSGLAAVNDASAEKPSIAPDSTGKAADKPALQKPVAAPSATGRGPRGGDEVPAPAIEQPRVRAAPGDEKPRARSDPEPAPAKPAAAKGERLVVIDALRGLTIAGMIYVNDSPSFAYKFLKHAAWHGWTPADIVFPSFLLIMGTSVVLALKPGVDGNTPRSELLRRVGRRCAIMFGLGVIEMYFMRDSTGGFQLFGILQSIAVCSYICSLFYLKTKPRTQAIAAGALLAGYWLLLTHVPVPGFGKGVLTPEGNLSTYVDQLVLGRWLHMRSFAPESLLGLIPKVASSLFGLLAGQWLQTQRSMTAKAKGLLFAGAAMTAAGLTWGMGYAASFPINKHLWTSSFALFAGGLSLMGLSATYWLVNIRKVTQWTPPFALLGKNSLLAYFLSGLLFEAQTWIPMKLADGSMGNLMLWFCHSFFPWFSPHNAALAYTTSYFLVFLGLLAILPGKKYLKL